MMFLLSGEEYRLYNFIVRYVQNNMPIYFCVDFGAQNSSLFFINNCHRNKKTSQYIIFKSVSIPSRITGTGQTVASAARMTPYAFFVADNAPSVTFTSAVFVPACHVHIFRWYFHFVFGLYCHMSHITGYSDEFYVIKRYFIQNWDFVTF